MALIVISLGGSLIVPDKMDPLFLMNFRKIILDYTKKNNKVIIICGGGNTSREYAKVANIINPSNEDLDRIGIKATELNAELIRVLFGKFAYPIIEPNHNKTNLNFKILISCGFKPGTSSDFDSVMWAKNYNASMVVNLSNTDYIYDKDPNKFKSAKKLINLNWKTLQKIVGLNWKPGLNMPFDPVATKMSDKLKLKVIFLNGYNLKNFENCLNKKSFIGSTVS